MRFAEDERPTLIKAIMVITKTDGPVPRIEAEKLNRGLVILRLRTGLLRDPASTPVKLKPTLEEFFVCHGYDLDPLRDSFQPYAKNPFPIDSQAE